MKGILIFFFSLLMFCGIAQHKNSLRLGLRVFKEADAPISFKRKLPATAYEFNLGLGLRARYARILSSRLSIGCESGFWYFYNNAVHTDLLPLTYKTRTQVLPLMGTLHFILFRKNNNWLSLGLKGGTAYVNTVPKLSDESVRIASRWSGLVEVSLTLQVFTKRKRVYHLGYGCDFLDKKFMRTAYFDFKHFQF